MSFTVCFSIFVLAVLNIVIFQTPPITMGKSITRNQAVKMINTSKTDRKMTITMVPDDQEKENTNPAVMKATSSLTDVGSKEALTKVRKKTTARVPPLTSTYTL